MADTVVDKLVIALQLDPKGIDKGIAQAQSKLETGFKGIIGKVFAPLMAGMSFAGIFDSIYSELKQMNSLSKTTKASIEDVTAWSRAVNISGGSVEEFSQTLMFLNQNLTRIAITGHGRIKPFFEKLGVDATELAKKPVLESLEAIGKAIDGMDKRESANMLRAMGFDGGTIKLLQSGEKGIRELIARQRELGVYTDKDAKAFSAMNKSFKEITSSIKTLFIPAVMLILDIASKVTKYLTNATVFIRKNLTMVRGALLLLAAVFAGPLYRAMVKFTMSFITNPFGMFVVGLTMLLLLLEDLWVYAKGGKSAFKDIWKNIGDPNKVMAGFKKAGEMVGRFFSFLGSIGSGKAGKTEKFIAILVAGIGLLIAAIGWIPVAITVAIGVILAYWEEIKAMFNSVVEWFRQTGKSISDFFNSIGSALSNAMSTAANTAKSAWNGFITWLEEKWNWIKSLLPSLSSIASKLPGFGNSVSLAAKSGGTTNNSAVTDNRQIVNNFNNKESVAEGEKKMGLVGYADTGVK